MKNKQKDIDRVAKAMVNMQLPNNARVIPNPTKKELGRKFVVRVARDGKSAKMEERK